MYMLYILYIHICVCVCVSHVFVSTLLNSSPHSHLRPPPLAAAAAVELLHGLRPAAGEGVEVHGPWSPWDPTKMELLTGSITKKLIDNEKSRGKNDITKIVVLFFFEEEYGEGLIFHAEFTNRKRWIRSAKLGPYRLAKGYMVDVG